MLNGDSCILMFSGVIYPGIHSFQRILVYQEKGWILGQNLGAKTPIHKTPIQKMLPSNPQTHSVPLTPSTKVSDITVIGVLSVEFRSDTRGTLSIFCAACEC